MRIHRLVYCLMAGVVLIDGNSHEGARAAKTHAGGMSEILATVVLNPAKV